MTNLVATELKNAEEIPGLSVIFGSRGRIGFTVGFVVGFGVGFLTGGIFTAI